DAASRAASIIDNDGTTHLGDYMYLGAGGIVVVAMPEPRIQCSLIGTAGGDDPDTGDIYRGLDRFGRVKDLLWCNSAGTTNLEEIKHGYDKAGNRLWRQDLVATAVSKKFDELYAYDGLDRLNGMERGTLNTAHDALTSKTFAQDW